MALPQQEVGQVSGCEPLGPTEGSIRLCWQRWCGRYLQVRSKTEISSGSSYPLGSPAALPVLSSYLYLPLDLSTWILASALSPLLVLSSSGLCPCTCLCPPPPLPLSLSISVSTSFCLFFCNSFLASASLTLVFLLPLTLPVSFYFSPLTSFLCSPYLDSG